MTSCYRRGNLESGVGVGCDLLKVTQGRESGLESRCSESQNPVLFHYAFAYRNRAIFSFLLFLFLKYSCYGLNVKCPSKAWPPGDGTIGPNGRKLGNWQHVLKEDIRTLGTHLSLPPPLPHPQLPGHHEVNSFLCQMPLPPLYTTLIQIQKRMGQPWTETTEMVNEDKSFLLLG
jgi:hypothetical protein